MDLRPAECVEQIHRAIYVVRCAGTDPETGRRCDALVDVPLADKAVCAVCGWVSPPWTGYSASHRTVVK